MSAEDKAVLEAKIAEGEKAERKKKRKEMKARHQGFWADFKKFITKGNIIDLAVAVVVGGAFNAIVTGFVKDVINPIISWVLSKCFNGKDLSTLRSILIPEESHLNDIGEKVVDKAAVAIEWGDLISLVINFLIIAFTVFVMVRTLARMHELTHKQELEVAAQKKAEEDAKAKAEAEAKAQAEADAKAAQDAKEQAFYDNVEKQTRLLEQIAASMQK